MVVVQILPRDSLQVTLVEDEDMVQTLSAQAAKKALAECVALILGSIKTFAFATCPRCHCREMLPELGVIVPNQVLGTLAPRRKDRL